MTAALDRFKALGAALISDVLDEAGFHSQTIDPTLRFVGASQAVCAPAICVRGERRVATGTDSAAQTTLPLYNLPTLAQPGGVLVMSTAGFRGGAVVGELLAEDLRQAQISGIVTDGLVRDHDALAALDLPILCAGRIPTNGARRFLLTGWGGPIHLPGPEGAAVTIAPGDLLLADADGAVAIPVAVADAVLRMAEELARKEVLLKADAAGQTPTARAEARAQRMSHIVWLRTSRG